jgi:hypothetical protein
VNKLVRAVMVMSSLLGIAAANAEDGNQLYSDCAAPLTKPESALCLGYVAGVIDALAAVQERKLSPMLICLPKGMRVGIVKDVIQKHLADHPEERKYDAASTIHAKLYELWPCPK